MVDVDAETAQPFAEETEVDGFVAVQFLRLMRLEQRQHEAADIFGIERSAGRRGQVSGDAQHDRRAGHQQNVGRISARRLLQDVIERSGTLRRARCAGRRFLAGRGAVQLRDYFGKFTIVFAHAVNSILARGELRSPDKLKHVPHITRIR